MSNGSKYGTDIVIVQERQYRSTSTYSYASRSSGASSGYYSSAMDSPSSSRRSSASNQAPDRTGTYRTGASDGYITDVKHNKKGKREVVIVHRNEGHSDPDAPRSSERYRS